MTDKKFNIEVMYQGKAEPGHIFAASYWDAIFKLTYYCGFKRDDIVKCEEEVKADA
jgi:hypothetical protein